VRSCSATGLRQTQRMGPGAVVAVSRNAAYTFSKPVRDEITLVPGAGVEGDVHGGVTVRHRSRVRADPTQPNLRQVHLIAAELFDEVRDHGYDVAPGQLGENVTTRGIDLLGLPRGTILRFGPAPDAAIVAGPPSAPTGGGAGGDAAQAADTRPAEAAGSDAAGLADVFATAHRATVSDATAEAVAAVAAAAVRDGCSDLHGPDPRPAVIIAGLRNPCAQINGFRDGLLRCVLGQDADGNVVRKAGVMGVVLRGGRIRPGDPVSVDLPPEPHLPLQRV
jgi:MOSC domain-containing protein YiiM